MMKFYKTTIMPIIFLMNFLVLTSISAKQILDEEITKTFNNLLQKEPDIPTKKFKVTTENRIIILEGTVDTRLQADKVIEIAHSIDNVKDVDTYNFKITNSKQYLTDAWLTSATKGKIIYLTRNNKISKNKIHVETTNGHVHLFGTIDDEQDLAVLKREINRIKGVKAVNLNIETNN